VRTTGTVTWIKMQQDGPGDLVMFQLSDSSTGAPEMFVLWSSDGTQLSPFSVWVDRSLLFSMLRDALVNKLEVNVEHGDTSSLAVWVQLNAA
jgi:hypothetical protein